MSVNAKKIVLEKTEPTDLVFTVSDFRSIKEKVDRETSEGIPPLTEYAQAFFDLGFLRGMQSAAAQIDYQQRSKKTKKPADTTDAE